MSDSIKKKDYISEVYAQALYQACGNKLEEEAQILLQVFAKENFFSDIKITNEIKIKIIEKLQEELKLSQELVNLAKVLLHNGRYKILNAVLSSYLELVKQARGEIDIEVTSYIPLDGKDKEKIAEILINKNLGQGLNKINISNNIDKKILGGFTIKINSEIIDASILAKLVSLKAASLKALLAIK